jgi:hypothetical protein
MDSTVKVRVKTTDFSIQTYVRLPAGSPINIRTELATKLTKWKLSKGTDIKSVRIRNEKRKTGYSTCREVIEVQRGDKFLIQLTKPITKPRSSTGGYNGNAPSSYTGHYIGSGFGDYIYMGGCDNGGGGCDMGVCD